MPGPNVQASHSDLNIHTYWSPGKTKILSMPTLVMTSVFFIIHYLASTKSFHPTLYQSKLVQKNPNTITSLTSYSHFLPLPFTPKSTTTSHTSPCPIKHLIHAKIHACYNMNLCYNCNKSYTLTHKCDSKQFFLHGNKEDKNDDLTEVDPTPTTSPQIKPHKNICFLWHESSTLHDCLLICYLQS